MIDRPVFYFDNKFKKLTQVRTAHVNAISECQDKVFNAKKVESISDATKQSIEYLTKRTKKVPPK
jgi:hypothetical protein